MNEPRLYPRDGYVWCRISTPSVYREYEIPIDGDLEGEDLAHYEELRWLAEVSRTTISCGHYYRCR